jgi:PKD repeat protein
MLPASILAPTRSSSVRRILSSYALAIVPGLAMAAVETVPLPKLDQNARLAIWGDSITEQRIYSMYTEAYLLACAGRKDVTVCVFGHDGETLGALLSRKLDLEAFHPTVVSFNYGMNNARDAIPWTDTHGTQFEGTLKESLAMLTGKGFQVIIAGPPYADWRVKTGPDAGKSADQKQQRNLALSHFRDIGLAAARRTGVAFADVNHSMEETLERARRTQPDYSYLDVHAAPNGHLAMAMELIKALGCNGDIGTITVDMHAGATASTGHTVVSSADGVVTLESTRYPFCCEYDPSSKGRDGSLGSVLPFLPFQQELNRFVLKVTNLGGESAQVTWGAETKSFTSAQLEAGINLAQEFASTPFDTTFARVMGAIADKQTYEQFMIKGTSNYFGNDAGGNIDANMLAVDAQKDAALKALLVPVRHTIVIVPAGKTAATKPVIAGTQMMYGTLGGRISQPAFALNTPTSFAATGLPNGLSVNPTTGEISGTPTAVGTSQATLTATNNRGSATSQVTITVSEPVPQSPFITSAKTAGAMVGKDFRYQIEASNDPTGFFAWAIGATGTPPTASSLPKGLTYDTRTGIVSGVPTVAGTFNISVAAYNPGGVNAGVFALTVAEAASK